jgi:hypothetical protein
MMPTQSSVSVPANCLSRMKEKCKVVLKNIFTEKSNEATYTSKLKLSHLFA